jgi:hypothetical protein
MLAKFTLCPLNAPSKSTGCERFAPASSNDPAAMAGSFEDAGAKRLHLLGEVSHNVRFLSQLQE